MGRSGQREREPGGTPPRPPAPQGLGPFHPITSLSAIGERCALMVFYADFLSTTILVLTCCEVLLGDLLFFHGISDFTWALVPQGLLALANVPLVLWFRRMGIQHLHFREHEAVLDGAFHQEEGGWPLESPEAELMELLDAIDTAQGWERQEARLAVKDWIQRNANRLDADTVAYLREHVGYLLPSGFAGSPPRQERF